MTVYFSPPEEEMIDSIQEIYGITYIEAVNQVIIQKRDLAFQHQRRGNFLLAETLLKELDEWNDEIAEEMNKQKTYGTTKKIYIPS